MDLRTKAVPLSHGLGNDVEHLRHVASRLVLHSRNQCNPLEILVADPFHHLVQCVVHSDAQSGAPDGLVPFSSNSLVGFVGYV